MKLSIMGGPQALASAVYASFNSGLEVGVQQSNATSTGAALATADSEGRTSVVRVKDSVLADTDLFVAVSTSAGLKELLYSLRNEIAGKSLVLAPGGFAGALRAASWFAEWDLPVPRIAEVTGFIVSGRNDGAQFRLSTIKRNLPFASSTEAVTQEMLADYAPYFPGFVASDLITTSLSNTNHMVHPGVVLLNAVRIQNNEPFSFYRNGLSPAVGSFLGGIDDERMGIVRALGAEELTLTEWMLRFYADQGMCGSNVVECLTSFPAFEDVAPPPALEYRYLTDDVPYGVAQYLELAKHLGTPSENLQTIVSSVGLLCDGSNRSPDEPSTRLFMNYLMQGTGARA